MSQRTQSSRRTPAFVTPMAAQVSTSLPDGPAWRYEVKLDGYRALILKDGSNVQIRSRRNTDLTTTYPTIAAAAARLRARSVVLDGEIVAVGPDGRPSFQALQHRSAHPDHAIVYYAFDVLHCDGVDLTRRPLDERVADLSELVQGSGLLVSLPLTGTARQVIEAVRSHGLEGVIAKRRDSTYQPGTRNDAWLKYRLDRQQEFVVGGYRPGSHGVDALVVGYYDAGKLRYAAKVRGGFTPHLRREVYERIKGLHVARCPFVDLPNTSRSRWGAGITAEDMKEIQWVKPRQLAQIRFVEWTADGHLRHAAFLGLRDDKPAPSVVRES